MRTTFWLGPIVITRKCRFLVTFGPKYSAQISCPFVSFIRFVFVFGFSSVQFSSIQFRFASLRFAFYLSFRSYLFSYIILAARAKQAQKAAAAALLSPAKFNSLASEKPKPKLEPKPKPKPEPKFNSICARKFIHPFVCVCINLRFIEQRSRGNVYRARKYIYSGHAKPLRK